MKKLFALGVLLSVAAAPSTAFAGCAHSHGSFDVSCENGVKVYRSDVNNLANVGPSLAQANLQIAKMNQDTARRRIAADRATARENAALRRRQIDNQRFATYSSTLGNSGYGSGNSGFGGYGYGGYGFDSGFNNNGRLNDGRRGDRRRGARGNNRGGQGGLNRDAGGVFIPGNNFGGGRRGPNTGTPSRPMPTGVGPRPTRPVHPVHSSHGSMAKKHH